MPISISDSTGLNYGGVIIKYDPSVLKAIDVAALGMLSGSYWKANTRTGEIRFAFATPLPMAGKGNLLMIDFEVLPNTTGRESILIFDTVEFPEIQHVKTVNGSVTILPEKTMLLQNYPNPFNPETWIPYQLAEPSNVNIEIYNSQGRLVRILRFGSQKAGIYFTKDRAAYWDGNDNLCQHVASGLYFYTLRLREAIPNIRVGEYRAIKKMVILK